MAQPPQTTRRPAGAAFLAIPLLAVLVLAGVGAAASLREGARAERVRGLVPFVGALTTLVHELQRERDLAVGPPAGQEDPGGAGSALRSARRAVDDAATAYRVAATRIDVSDRDRKLRQRFDAGLAGLAGLAALRASVDTPETGDPAAAWAAAPRSLSAISRAREKALAAVTARSRPASWPASRSPMSPPMASRFPMIRE